MKILCLSDLHLNPSETDDFLISKVFSTEMAKVHQIVIKNNPDVIILTGDTVFNYQIQYLDIICSAMFGDDIPVMLCLGNHETWGFTVEYAQFLLSNQMTIEGKEPQKNIFHLDIGETYEHDNVQFVGGMLFFDGSMRFKEDQQLTPWNGWQDWRITNVERYEKICNDYIERFASNIKPGKSIMLCTHHLSNEKLNGHEPSVYSFYSGVKDISSRIDFDKSKDHWLICGHTHKRVINEISPGFHGINVGSDYGKILSYSFTI